MLAAQRGVCVMPHVKHTFVYKHEPPFIEYILVLDYKIPLASMHYQITGSLTCSYKAELQLAQEWNLYLSRSIVSYQSSDCKT